MSKKKTQEYGHLEKKIKSDPVSKALKSVERSLGGLKGANLDSGTSHVPLIPLPNKNVEVVFPLGLTVKVTGSYLNNTMLSTGAIDILILVDYDSLFKPRDELNYQYFWKKQLMMWHVAEKLQGSCIDRFNAIYAFEIDSVKFTIRIGIRNNGALRLHRLSPGRCNILPPFLKSYVNVSSLEPMPTPHYNSLILRDFLHSRISDYQATILGNKPQLVECIKLIKAWNEKMQFSKAVGCPDSFALSMLFCHWVTEHCDLADCDSLQLFKGFVSYISLKDSQKPTALGAVDTSTLPEEYKAAFSFEEFSKVFETSFIDNSGMTNIFSHVTVEGLKIVAFFAKKLLDCLNSHVPYSLEDLIVTKDNEYMLYDFSIELDLDNSWVTLEPVDFIYSCVSLESLSKRAICIIRTALNDRLRLISAVKNSENRIKILVKVECDTCFGLVDLGPKPGESDQVAAFKKLWGSRAELRKFDSGIVQWAAAWPEFSGKRHLIVPTAICYLLKEHRISKVCSFLCNQFDFMLESTGVHLAPFSYFLEAFDFLSSILRGIMKLPIGIVQVVPISELLRYTSVFPSIVEPRVAGRASPVVEALLIFERSSKWPDDLQALKSAKHAFFIQLQRVLEQDSKVPCSIDACNDYLDVFCRSIVFRFRIRLEKEIKLLDSEGFLEESKKLCHIYNDRPLFHAKIHVLATQNAVFGPTVRILKRWSSSQLFSFVDDDLFETICGIVFSQPNLGSSPGSVVSGFYRALHYISTHRHDVPFVFDPDISLNEETLADIQKDCSLVIYCSFLRNGKYNVKMPSVIEWKQLQRLAKASLMLIDDLYNVQNAELLQPVLLESCILRGYTIPRDMNNSVLCQRDKKPAELIDRMVRRAAGPKSDFVKSLPGLIIVEQIAKKSSAENGFTCYYDKYDGSVIGVPIGAPDITGLLFEQV